MEKQKDSIFDALLLHLSVSLLFSGAGLCSMRSGPMGEIGNLRSRAPEKCR